MQTELKLTHPGGLLNMKHSTKCLIPKISDSTSARLEGIFPRVYNDLVFSVVFPTAGLFLEAGL